MFDFFKRKKKKEEAKKPGQPAQAAAKPAPIPGKAAATVPLKPPPAKPEPSKEEPELRIGQMLRVPGLGDFTIHDVKGGKGKSGMGIVYIVFDISSMTPFAVKTFQKWCLGTPELVQRFLREAETWIRLEQQENIVRAHYVSIINDQPYVFLEYVAGSDLRRKLTGGALSPRDALRYSIQFCRGMAHAHNRVPGLVHRDVKPENCMFTPNDILKVTDFGLVKVLAGGDTLPVNVPAGEESASESASRFFKTRVGEMGVGTLPYMAPEQFTDFSRVTVRADIYSFGVMLYEMLTGHRPFKARSPEDWYVQHFKMMPTEPALQKPEVGQPLSDLTMRCLAKKAEARYPDFATIEKELAKILKQSHDEEVPRVEAQEFEAWEIVNKGAALSYLGRAREALGCFEKALEILPRLDAAWLNKGVALSKLGRDKEALECYEKATEINPNLADAWYNRGIAYQNQRLLEDARTSYERTLTLNPLHESAWLNQGVVLRRLSRPQDAIECYDRVLAINSQSSVAWYNKGFALSQLGRLTDGIQCYDRALSLNPQYLEAWLNRGVALRKQNRLIEALACYEKVLEIQPKHPDGWYNKGVVLRKLGQKNEAQNAFQKAAALDPKIAEQIKQQGLN
ncbi:MAG TPA: serine/threonine-protein kinase [Terriglobales bacterium]|jgi:tetratricopeptide (TPR) repeat protein|nr:serine/threonine-protein kinase [Terriglobales bacterium]